MSNYRHRVADNLIEKHLESMGMVLVQGAKWCGKTTTSAHIAKSALYMDDPAQKVQNIMLGQANPARLLVGDTPRLIDEWELVPELWDAARFEIDHRDVHQGQFIFTGSSVPKKRVMDKMFHSGTGRVARVTMRPMSLWESGDSTGTVSLEHLFASGMVDGESSINLDKLAYLVCRGGWPESLNLKEETSLIVARDYLDGVIESDLTKIDDVKRDYDLMRRIIRCLSRHQGGQVPISTIYADLTTNNQHSYKEETLSEYIGVLKQIFLEEDMGAWNPNLRSKAAIRTSDTRYFVDSSIATASLGIGPNDLINDMETFGFLFETMAIRDLRIYTDVLDGNVYHYRDNNNLECDAVIHLRNGKYGLVEVKIGGENLIDSGASSLLSLTKIIDSKKMNSPSFLMVLTGIGAYPYQRKDGVMVVPIGCLKP